MRIIKISFLLTALLMLIGLNTHAQSVKGDVNFDNQVDESDIETVIKIIKGFSDGFGDVNGDGYVNVADIVEIVNIMMTPVSTGNPVVTFNVMIVNNTGQVVTLDGDLEFVLSNPDHNGNHFAGLNSPYIKTGPIRFHNSAVTIPSGTTMTFCGLTWCYGNTNQGLGEMSPLDPSLLSAASGTANVSVYVNGSTEVVRCVNMSPNIVFANGATYMIDLTNIKT